MIVNPGSIEKLSWAEINDEKGFIWADLYGKETSTEFIKLNTRPMEIKKLSLSKKGKYPKGLIKYILAFLNQSKNPEKILKLVMNGLLSQKQYAELKTNEILAACNDSFFNLQMDRKDLEIEGYGRVFMEKMDNPVEAYSKRLDLIIGKLKQDNPEKKFLESVKRLGIKYLEATK
jgi:DNA repair exonuclease SbcCD nuclease subunit